MATKRDRIFAGFFAGLFLFTSSALTIAIIVQATQDDNKDAAKTQSTTNSEAKVDDANKLQGKQLADFTPIAKVDQLQTIDTTPGTGAEVKEGQTVSADYTGAIASTGKIFQSSKDTGQPVSFPLSQVIKGWQEGIPGMKVGGTRRLIIPAAQAYGSQSPSSDIPANADLVFDVTIHSAK